MYTLTAEIAQDHQHALLDEANQSRRGDRLARSVRLRNRARQAARRSRVAKAHLS
jgi:hypothetical protein